MIITIALIIITLLSSILAQYNWHQTDVPNRSEAIGENVQKHPKIRIVSNITKAPPIIAFKSLVSFSFFLRLAIVLFWYTKQNIYFLSDFVAHLSQIPGQCLPIIYCGGMFFPRESFVLGVILAWLVFDLPPQGWNVRILRFGGGVKSPKTHNLSIRINFWLATLKIYILQFLCLCN